MGNCQCNQTQQFPDLNKMTMSKISTGQNFMHKPQFRYNMSHSVMLSQSIINSRLQKIASNQDHRISNINVKNTYKNLPATQASRFRDLMIKQQELYIESLNAKYVGQITDQKPHGFGKLYFKNDDFLQGMFVHGRCQGKGRFIKSDGSYYDGDFKNNVADGYGSYIGRKGFRYQGQWKNNVPNGSGQALYPDGTRYVGQFFNNKKHGKGTLYQCNNIYRGEFKNDNFDGKLKYQGQNGQTYDGGWKQSKKHGFGIYTWPDGSIYEGQYVDGKREGKGKMTYPNNQVYDGQWQEGQKHGKGHLISQKQNITGIWRNSNLVSIQTG